MCNIYQDVPQSECVRSYCLTCGVGVGLKLWKYCEYFKYLNMIYAMLLDQLPGFSSRSPLVRFYIVACKPFVVSVALNGKVTTRNSTGRTIVLFFQERPVNLYIADSHC